MSSVSALAAILVFVQNKFIEQLGSMYGMLMTTFDPDEIPLLRYCETNERELVDFANTAKQIRKAAFANNITSGLRTHEILYLFDYYYQEYFSLVVEVDERPITFKTFRTWFERFKQGGGDLGNIPTRPMQLFFARSNKYINSLVADALMKTP